MAGLRQHGRACVRFKISLKGGDAMTRVFKPEWRKRIPAICTGCNLEFSAVESEVKRGNGRFCSRQCQRSFQARCNAKAMRTGESRQERSMRWRKSVPPEVHAAHDAVETALRNGSLVRQPCELCGAERVDAHHDDYSQPLQVRWLCRGHHLAHHRAKSN